LLEDLGSTNGTYLNGARIVAPYELSDGDRIQLGEHTLLRVSLQDATEQNAARLHYEASVIDALTGAYNRRHLELVLTAEWSYARRHRSALSLIFIDLDHFNELNTIHGHQAGDALLRMMTREIREAIRTEDMVARYGGEEFVLVLRGIDMNGALVMAERVRRTVEAMSVPFRGEALKITASCGVASFEAATPYNTWEELIAAADRAVYRAKAKGRNCVCEAQQTAADSWQG
jgi:diguanylate cyclase (GGDEF)-like protein